MDDGRDRHARHVRGLVAANDILASPGLSAGGRLRRLCDVVHATVASHRSAVFVTDDEGACHVEHRLGPPLDAEAERDELVALSAPPVRERLVRREPVTLGGGAQPAGRGTLVVVPMALDGELWGYVAVEGTPEGTEQVDDLTIDTLTGFATLAAHVILAERLRTDRAKVLSRELLTEQRNRRRISNRLHDGPQQILVSLRMRLQLLERAASDELAEEIHRLAGYVEAARDDLRSLILDLDTMTGHTVLSNALRSLLETNATVAGWRTSFECEPGVDAVSEETQLTVERVVQEALANARQHAEASNVSIQARQDDGTITIAISDDGVGIPAHVATTSTGNSGVRAMHERIWLVGGTLQIDSDAGRGTRVEVTAPRYPTAPGIGARPT